MCQWIIYDGDVHRLTENGTPRLVDPIYVDQSTCARESAGFLERKSCLRFRHFPRSRSSSSGSGSEQTLSATTALETFSIFTRTIVLL